MNLEKLRQIILFIFDFLMLILLAETVYIFYQISKYPEVLRPIVICDPYASLYQNKLKELNPITNPFGFVEAHQYFKNLSLEITYLNVTEELEISK